MEDSIQALTEAEQFLVLEEDLWGATFDYKQRTNTTLAVARRIVNAYFHELHGIPSSQKFIGYYSDEELPIKPGMVVTIKKGTIVKTYGRDPKPAGKTYKVKVDHILNGCTRHLGESQIVNPAVRWAGPGGYWSAVDINLIPEAL
jgi:hypothetical protein